MSLRTIASLFSLVAFTIFFSCQNTASTDAGEAETPETQSAKGISFASVKNNFNNHDLVLPEGAQVDILFTEKIDSVVTGNGEKYPAKGKQDFIAYMPIDGSSQHGHLYVNHELRDANPQLGDSGGMTMFEVKKEDGYWKVVGDMKYIDFSKVGGTWHNCGGTVTPHGTILTAEEYPPASNEKLYHDGEHFTDTSNFMGLKRNEVMGWMVEVDPETGQPLHKLVSMGRYSHEDAHCMPDGKTVYLTDDYSPAVFFKFVADKAGDYTQGTLYAFQEGESGIGNWIELPDDTASLVNIREIAIQKGATAFIRHEWVDGIGEMVYITESGSDNFDWNKVVDMGGKPASYLKHKGNNVYHDPHGRVLALNTKTNELSVLVEGGIIDKEGPQAFSSPDGLTTGTINGKDYLVICEDIIGLGEGRVSDAAEAKGEKYNELYFLDASLENATVNDLVRFSVGPRGCEQTGPEFTPDHKTMFLSVQSPDSDNKEPFNRTTVVAITGVFE